MNRDRAIVLVHGAWQTAGTWDLLHPRLEESGRRVFIALLTGSEADATELTGAVTLSTHVRDVLQLLEREDLHDVVLVGHSYGGMIITAVAEHAGDRLAHLVYLDGFIPDHGQSALQLLPESIRTTFRTQAQADGGWRLRASERLLDLWGLEPGPAREFVRARLCDFTIRCFEERVDAPSQAAASLGRTYLACVRGGYPAQAVFAPFAERARRGGWAYHELPAGHDCHVEMPNAVAQLVLTAC